jgi:hypothetical protein
MTTAVASRETVFAAGVSPIPPAYPSPVVGGGGVRSSRRIVPLFVPADEAYYWSRHWQQGVAESMRDLQAGDFKDFDSDDPNDVARWLLDVDADDCA